MYTLLNTSIVTEYGKYEYQPVGLEEAKTLIHRDGYESAIGHASTAEILGELLDKHVEVNRVNYQQQKGDVALVFKLRGRPPEGTILTRQQIEAIGYDFGLLHRYS